MSDNPFIYTDAILQTKNYQDDLEGYLPFLINRSLSFYIDTVLYAMEMSKYPDLPHRMQYDYYFYSVRKMKRQYAKWPKKPKDDQLQMIMEYYGVNRPRAEEYLDILTDDQLKEIKEMSELGG